MCHLGIFHTLDFLQRWFWWPSIKEDIKVYVEACPVCSQGKSTHQQPQGLLHPLTVPRRPWSHLSLDFVTGLPPSQGNTVILVVVDRFSKAARLIPLPKLPSATETAELLMNHVFRVFGIPLDIVSDRGPQFSSLFWGAFCSLIGATASLSSWFHPDSNGQTERINQDLETTLWCMAPITPPLGLPTSCGLNMPATASCPRPLDYPPLNASSGIPHRLAFPLPGVWSNAVGRPGRKLGVSFFRPPRDTNVSLTAATGRHLISELVKESS